MNHLLLVGFIVSTVLAVLGWLKYYNLRNNYRVLYAAYTKFIEDYQQVINVVKKSDTDGMKLPLILIVGVAIAFVVSLFAGRDE